MTKIDFPDFFLSADPGLEEDPLYSPPLDHPLLARPVDAPQNLGTFTAEDLTSPARLRGFTRFYLSGHRFPEPSIAPRGAPETALSGDPLDPVELDPYELEVVLEAPLPWADWFDTLAPEVLREWRFIQRRAVEGLWDDAMDYDLNRDLFQADERHMTSGEPATHTRCRTRDGSTLWLQVQGRPPSTWGRGEDRLGSFRKLPAETPEDFTMPPRPALPAEGGHKSPAKGWHPIDLDPYFEDADQASPEATLLVRTDGVGLLYPGMTHSIYGESESGKSMLVQAEAARLLKAGARVLYLDYEADPRSVVERFKLMGCTSEAIKLLDYRRPEAEPASDADAELVWEVLLRGDYTLAVIDGVTEALTQAPVAFRSAAGLGGNDDVTAWMNRVPRVIAERTGAAVVTIDHVAKGPDAGRFAIGGQAKMAALSGAAYLVKPRTPLGRGQVGELDVYVAKDRHGYVRPRSGEMNKDRLQLVATATVDGREEAITVSLDPPSTRPTADDFHEARKIEVAKVLAGLPADHPGLGKTALRREVRGKAADTDEALAGLVRDGYVTRTAKGQSYLHRLVKPYEPDFDEEL